MSTINDHYPRSFQKLFSFFTVVEKLFVFSVKRKLRCTLQLLQSLYVSFDTSESHVEYTNDEFLREFRLLSALCPLGIQLSQSNEERAHIPGLSYTGLQMSLNDIELSFPLFSGASPSQSTKRIKMLHAAFNEYLSDRYTKDADSKVRNHYTFTKVKKDGWPPGFDSESIPLPTLPALQIEFHSLAPSSSQSGPATTSEQNPDDNINLQDSAAALEEYQDDSDGEMRTDACHAPSPLQDCSTGSSEPVSLSSIGGAHTVLERLKGLEGFYRDQIVHTETMPGRVATFEDLRTHTINEDLLRVVRERIGVKKFYTHQAKAINYILEGKHVVVSTATSSGKSVIYNLPIMSKILEDNRVTALYLFPTKVKLPTDIDAYLDTVSLLLSHSLSISFSCLPTFRRTLNFVILFGSLSSFGLQALAQDQLRVLQAIICNNDSNTGELVLPVWAMACDGDTGFCDRRDARQSANIILTNPDMLHCTFLPNVSIILMLFIHLPPFADIFVLL